MRGYKCYYFRLHKGKLRHYNNTACWAGLNRICEEQSISRGDSPDYDNTIVPNTNVRHIYIKDWKTEDMPNNYNKLLEILNTMTSCKVVTFRGKEYIRYKLICNGNYYANLVFLNFIRMIWYKSSNLYNKYFFKSLDEYDNNEDGLQFLLRKINDSINDDMSYGWGSHSLVYKNIKPKTFKELKIYFKKYPQSYMKEFLIN